MMALTVALFAGLLQASHAAKQYMVWDGCWQMPGNFHNGTVRGGPRDSVSTIAAVRCCKDATAGPVTCETDVNGKCNEGDWSTAKKICEDNGHRLCTLTELQSNICCNTGCNYDYMHPVWTSTEYKVYAQRAPCPGTEGRTNDINYTANGPTGLGIAVCYNANSAAKFKQCSPNLLMYGWAEKCCADLAPEGNSNWKIPGMADYSADEMCAPGVLTDKGRHIWTDSWYTHTGWVAADGCKIRNYGSNKTSSGSDDYYYNTFEQHAVRCCSYDGGFCKTATRFGCESSASWHEAHEACHEQGMRLCTAKEMNSYKCCVTGCMFDVDRVWTGTLQFYYQAARKLVVNRTTGENKCDYAGDVSSSSTDLIGVVCCGSDGDCVDPFNGSCHKVASPSAAQKLCNDHGLELCRNSRFCSRCRRTKCWEEEENVLTFKTYTD